nr:SDR family NAD(P)-dependent oxidoreductase [Pseudomonas sp.]
MKYKLKPVQQQVMVITGAGSGIGRATAQAAAKQGARLVLACRNEQALNQLVDELRKEGADAIAVPTDVGIATEHEKLLEA